MIYPVIRRTYPGLIFGELRFNEHDISTAESVVVTDGTITSGTVEDTKTVNLVYFVVNESDQFKIDFTFNIGLLEPGGITLRGRYESIVPHEVKLKIWNYVLSQWDDVTEEDGDMPTTFEDGFFRFQFPSNREDYVDTDSATMGEVKIRLDHISVAINTHNIFIDYIAIESVSVDMPVSGLLYPITGFDLGGAHRVLQNPSTGELTVESKGLYLCLLSMSYTGSAAQKIHAHARINEVDQHYLGAAVDMPTAGELGSMSGHAILSLEAGDVVCIHVGGFLNDSFISVDHCTFTLLKLR